MGKPDPAKCLGYFRVSTQRQATDGHALERYHDQLLRFGVPEDQIFWDTESGRSDARKGFNEVLRLMRSRNYTHIVVPCFDRFQRSALIWEKVRSELSETGVGFIELDTGVETDLSTPTGILNTQLRAAYAEFQANQNRYNSLQGQKFRRSQRKPFQRCFGYLMEGDRLVVNRTPYRDTGKTYEEIALELIDTFIKCHGHLGSTILEMNTRYGCDRLPSRSDYPRQISGLRYWLKNPALRGMLVYFPREEEKRIEIPNTHEAIMSPAVSAEVLALLERNSKQQSRGRERRNPLIGLAYCGLCGSRSRPKKCGKRGWYWYMYCAGAYPEFGKPRTCNARGANVRLEKVEAAVIKAIVDRAEAIDRKMNVPDEIEMPQEAIALQKQISQLKSLDDPDLGEAIALKEAKLAQILENQIIVQDRRESSAEKLRGMATDPVLLERLVDRLSVEERSIFYLDLVKQVVITGMEISVELTI